MDAASNLAPLSSGLKAPDDVEAGQSRGASRAPATADERLEAFMRQHCICRTCRWVVDRPAEGIVTCKHPEGAMIDGVPHDETSRCECHDFADPKLAAEMSALLDDLPDEDADFCNPSNPLSPLNPCSPLDGIGF